MACAGMEEQFMEFNRDGSIMTDKEKKKRRKKEGLCILCGNTKVRKDGFPYGRKISGGMDGEVYNGHCLRCYETKDGKTFKEKRKRHHSHLSAISQFSNTTVPVTLYDEPGSGSIKLDDLLNIDAPRVRKVPPRRAQSYEAPAKSLSDAARTMGRPESFKLDDLLDPPRVQKVSQRSQSMADYDIQATSHSNSPRVQKVPASRSQSLYEFQATSHYDSPQVQKVSASRSKSLVGYDIQATSPFDSAYSPERKKRGMIKYEPSISNYDDHSKRSYFKDSFESKSSTTIEIDSSRSFEKSPSSSSLRSIVSTTTAIEELKQEFEYSDFASLGEILKKNRDDTSLQHEAFKMLRNLSPYVKLSSLNPHVTSIVNAIVHNMENNPDCLTSLLACSVMWRLSSVSNKVAKAGAVDVVINVINKDKTDEDTVMWACGALSNLIKDSYSHHVIRKEKGVKLLANVLNHPNYGYKVKVWACRALYNAIMVGGKDFRNQIKDNEILAVINMIKSADCKSDCVEFGCMLIWLLFPCDCSEDVSEKAVDTIFHVLSYHQEENIQYLACGALAQLANSCEIIVNKRLEDIIKTITRPRYLKSVNVQQQGLRALLNLCQYAAIMDEVSLCGIHHLVDVTKEHHNEAGIIERVCDILAILCTTGENIRLFATRGGFSHAKEIIDMIGDFDRKMPDELFTSYSRLIWNYCMASYYIFSDEIIRDNDLIFELIDVTTSAILFLPYDDQYQTEAFSLLLYLSASDDEARGYMLREKIVTLILSGMENNVKSFAVQQNACKLISNLFSNEHKSEFKCSADEIRAIERAMKKHSGEDMQIQVCEVLQNIRIRFNENSISALIDIIDFIIEHTMKVNYINEKVQHACCCALFSLSALNDVIASEIASEIASTSGLRSIFLSMVHHPTSERIRNNALGVLWNLSTRPEYVGFICSCCEIETISDILVRALDQRNLEIQTKAVTLLRIWFDESLELQTYIAEYPSTAKVIFEMVKNNLDSEEIYHHACGAIVSITRILGGEFYIPREILVFILQAMDKFTNSEGFQLLACRILYNVVLYPKGNNMSTMTLIESVIKAIKRFPDTFKIQKMGLCMLGYVVTLGNEWKQAISQAGGIEITVNVMSNRMENPLIQNQCCHVLWGLCTSIEKDIKNAEKIGSKGALSHIICGMLANIENKEVQEQGFGALQVLTFHEKNRERLLRSGGLSGVEIIMEYHSDSLSILCKGWYSLANMVNPSEDSDTFFPCPLSKITLDLMLSSMQVFPDSEDLAYSILLTLHSFLTDVVNTVTLNNYTSELKNLLYVAAGKFPGKCGEKLDYLVQFLGF